MKRLMIAEPDWGGSFFVSMNHKVLPFPVISNISWVWTWQLASCLRGMNGRAARPLTSDEVFQRVKRLDPEPLQWPAYALVFDDGYEDWHRYGTPILRSHGSHGIACPEMNPTKFGPGRQLSPTTLKAMLDSGVWSLGTHGYVGHGDGSVYWKYPTIPIGPRDTVYNNRLYIQGLARYETDSEMYARFYDDLYRCKESLAPYGNCPLVSWPLGLWGGNGNARDTIPDMWHEILDELEMVAFSWGGLAREYHVGQGVVRPSPDRCVGLTRQPLYYLKWWFDWNPVAVNPVTPASDGWPDSYLGGCRLPGVGWIVGRSTGGRYYVGNEDTIDPKGKPQLVQPEDHPAYDGQVLCAVLRGEVWAAQSEPGRLTRIVDLTTGAATRCYLPGAILGLAADDDAGLLYMITHSGFLKSFDPNTGASVPLGKLPDAATHRYGHGQVLDGHFFTYCATRSSLRKIRISDQTLVDEWTTPYRQAFYPWEVTKEYVIGKGGNQRVMKCWLVSRQ